MGALLTKGRKRILVLDDERLARQVIVRAIGRLLDVDVIEAASNQEAKNVLAKGGVDAIFMDFTRPGGNALEFMRDMSSYCRHRNVGVVVVSAGARHYEPEIAKELLDLGVFALDQKPMSVDVLQALAERLLAKLPSDPRLVQLLLGTEDANVDYKDRFSFGDLNAVARVAKDVIAMANTPKGGQVFFGVRQADAGLEYRGLGPEEIRPFDPTAINDALAKFIAPLTVTASVLHHGAKAYGYICVTHDPTRIMLARAEYAPAALFLGRVYHRTDAARSEEVRDSETLAIMIERCVNARRDRRS